MIFRSTSPAMTEQLGQRIARRSHRGEIYRLEGGIGAGKTTFVRGFLKAFGVRGRIVSPTFLIRKVYRVRRRGVASINHLDGYRIRRQRELLALGLDEVFADPAVITLVEWPRAFRGVLRNHKTISIRFSPLNESARAITLPRRLARPIRPTPRLSRTRARSTRHPRQPSSPHPRK